MNEKTQESRQTPSPQAAHCFMPHSGKGGKGYYPTKLYVGDSFKKELHIYTTTNEVGIVQLMSHTRNTCCVVFFRSEHSLL